MQYTIAAYHLVWDRSSNATEIVSTTDGGVNVPSLRFVTRNTVSWCRCVVLFQKESHEMAVNQQFALQGHNFERLRDHILPLSHASTFSAAATEWDLVAIEISDEFDSCPCGQDIKEHCFIHNRVTGHRTHVGNVCINRFLAIDTGTLFDGLKRIKGSRGRANFDLIEHAHRMGYLYDLNEYAFLVQIRHKRILSPRQLNWEQKIHRRILSETVVAKRSDPSAVRKRA